MMRWFALLLGAVAVCTAGVGSAWCEELPSLRPVVPGYRATVFYGGGIAADGIAVRPDGSLLVVAEWYQGVPEGVYVAYEGDRCDIGDAYTTLGAPFDNPDGICLHPDGRVFVGDPGISVLWVIPSPGAPPEVLLDSLPAPCYALVAPPWFDGPDVDPGDLLICDWAYPTGGLYAVDQDTLAAVRLAGPPDLEDGLHTAAFGPSGELYAMDTDYQERDGIRIVTISPSGDVTPIIDDYVVSPGTQQCGPLAVHPVTGKLYFCNSAATGTVYRSEPDGSAVEVFAAGAGSIASTGMAFNADGSALFVSDENSGMVVKITGTDLPPSASSPQIDDVLVDRGRDTDAPGWPVPSYHQRVTVRASDPDGASDIVSVTITDADGIDHTVHFYDYESWWEEDADTIRCEFPQWHLAAPPTPGMYAVRVVDTSENEDSLTTPVAPAVPESCPQIVSPGMDSVVYDSVPTFRWTPGLAGSVYRIRLEEEGTAGEIWTPDVGASTESVYDFDGSAAIPALQPNHSYFWCVEEWRLEESGPRTSVWTAHHTRGRFAVYGDWPETPPALPGMLAYTSYHWDLGSAWEWGMSSVMQYHNDPANRTWLGPDWSQDPDWSPDGAEILFVRTERGRPVDPSLWMDPLGPGAPVEIPGVSGIMSRWSPLGDQVCYAHYVRDGSWDVRVAGIDGSGETVVAWTGSNAGWPSWSPDGMWIAYRCYPDYEGQRLWAVRPDGTDAHPVMATGLAGYPTHTVTYMGEQAWSPDGTTLAVSFIAEPPGGHWIGDSVWGIGTLPAEGGTLTPVAVAPPGFVCCGVPRLPQWSPDGTKIAFSSGHHLPDPTGYMEFETGVEIWLINADGSGDPVRLTYNNSFDNSISWTPVGTTDVGLHVSVTVGNVTATYEEVLSAGSTTIVISDDHPAPAPLDLTFVEDFSFEIRTSAEISGTVTVEMDYSDTAYPPVLGERLSLLLWDGVEWVDITTAIDTAAYTITGQFTPGAEREWRVVLVLDRPEVPKVKVMFEGCTAGRPSGPGLFVADADLSNIVRLTLPEMGSAVLPECVCGCGHLRSTWSPQGTRVAMWYVDSGELYVMDIATLMQVLGQEPQPLTDEFGEPIRAAMPAWSPAGDQLVYAGTTHAGPGAAIESINVVNADGTGAHAIYTFPEPVSMHFRYPEWSPDGTRIAFAMDWDLRYEGHLFLLEGLDDPGGPTLRQLTTDDAYHEESPHWSPDGRYLEFTRSPWGVPSWEGGDIWIKDVETGMEAQLTDTPSIGEYGEGWCPYDGCIYYLSSTVNRILPDGTGDEVVAPDVYPMTTILHDFWWARTGAWIDSLNALPGESVTAKAGIADAESLAGVQAQIRYTGGSDTLTFDSILQGESILDWVMMTPSIGPDVASVLAFASDPGSQSVSGAAHLFDLNVANSAAAQPGDLQLLTFDDFALSDDWGNPIDRISFAGGVRAIPFLYLEVSDITGPVCADPEDPVPFSVTITALDREGWSMPGCDAPVEFATFSWYRRPWAATPVTPTGALLVDGSWSGEVALVEPGPSQQLFAHWGDMAGYSNWFRAIGRGDADADDRVSIYDVIKIANIAIERGEWEPWQLWAADFNGDGEVNIFDVLQAASKALEDMGALVALDAAAPVLAESVTATASTTQADDRVVLSVALSDCAGLAGIQVELEYGSKKLAYSGVAAGDLLAGTSSWTLMANDLGGTVKAIAYTPSREVLPGGEGTILTFGFDRIGRGTAKVRLRDVKLSALDGTPIACQMGRGKKGRGGPSVK